MPAPRTRRRNALLALTLGVLLAHALGLSWLRAVLQPPSLLAELPPVFYTRRLAPETAAPPQPPPATPRTAQGPARPYASFIHTADAAAPPAQPASAPPLATPEKPKKPGKAAKDGKAGPPVAEKNRRPRHPPAASPTPLPGDSKPASGNAMPDPAAAPHAVANPLAEQAPPPPAPLADAPPAPERTASAPAHDADASTDANTPHPPAASPALAAAPASAPPVGTPFALDPPDPPAPETAPETAPDTALATAAQTALPAPPGPPAPAASAAAPSHASRWPGNTRLRYQLGGYYRGELHGDAHVLWQREGARYQAVISLDVGLLLRARFTSQGDIGEHGLQPRVYEEQVRQRRRGVRIEPGGVRLNNGERLPRPDGVQDAASQLVEMAQRFATGQAPLAAGGQVRLWLARPGGVDEWVYDVLGEQTLHLPRLGPVPAIHLKPRPVSKPRGSISAEIWFAPSLQYLPVRILLTMKDEARVDLLVLEVEQD